MKEKRGEHPFGDLGQLTLAALFLAVWVEDSFFLHWSTLSKNWVPGSARMGMLGLGLLFVLVLIATGQGVITGKERPTHTVDWSIPGLFAMCETLVCRSSPTLHRDHDFIALSLFLCIIGSPIFVFYDYIASYEEKLLEARFGEAYRQYERRTARWLPRVGREG